MANSPRKNSTTSLSITWNDAGLEDIFNQLKPENQEKANKDALRTAGNSLKRMAQADARTMGLGKIGRKSDEGWEWQTYGRIPNATTVGKAWSRGARQGVRVYMAAARSKGFLRRAYHANPVIAGYRQKIPGKKGQAAVFSGEKKAGKPVFARARLQAPLIFRKAVESNLRRLIKRLNKKYGGKA